MKRAVRRRVPLALSSCPPPRATGAPSPLPAEKRLERRLRLVRLEPPLEKLRLLVDPPHDLGGGAADQASRGRSGFCRQRPALTGGVGGPGLPFPAPAPLLYHPAPP